MATYVVLVNWTDQGIRNVEDTIGRSEAFRALSRQLNGEVKELYWTLGPYDIVGTFEAPDDETATAIALAISKQGNVRTTTMRAYDPDEMRGILGKLP
ncbi:MAG: GYD domain-containing protein [Carbonactinosporaceae bacterium]